MSLKDAMQVRTWKYTVACPTGKRYRYTINENLTGAVLGHQKPARINFRTALLIVEGWNRIGTGVRFFLLIPNPPN